MPSEKDTLAVFIQKGEQAIERSDFATAKALFRTAQELSDSIKDAAAIKDNAYLIQRLALSAYKAEQPAPVPALKEALQVLAPLKPEETHDPETIALAGDIEKRLFECDEGLEQNPLTLHRNLRRRSSSSTRLG